MIGKLITSIVGSANERELKRIAAIVEMVNLQEPAMQARSDEELRALTSQFKQRLADGETLDDILPEAFAAAREASVRTLFMRPFDVQVVVGVALHEGKVAEMKTGEGKTLAATMPLYLNALTEKGCHLVTVNDYLAKRDAKWMGQIFKFLGMTVGYIVHDLDDEERMAAYRADITYGTNNEFGFDYLRDNLKMNSAQVMQLQHHFAIVDEVDSILIDEARTPLIISGPVPESHEDYQQINTVVKFLKTEDHFKIDEKARTALLTEDGVALVEQRLNVENLYDPENSDTLHKVENLLKAHNLYKRDKDYMVKGREVVLVDDFTGRLMPGRRLSDGLHQAIEAKENVQVHAESQTYASISFQNYFRMYEKLAGMTGTADTEAIEFKQIYKLDVLVIPTNKPMVRKDHPDHVYASIHDKIAAVVADIQDCYEAGQPVLVGTTSIEKSEALSRVLKGGIIEKEFKLPEEEEEPEPEIQYDEDGNPVQVMPKKKKKKKKAKFSKSQSRWEPVNVPHNVLNAKNHAQEADIVAQAGRLGKVTIATNMAGRGTDIQLGGNPESLAMAEAGAKATSHQHAKALEKYKTICDDEKRKVLQAGGLHIIGTERHESRRIDNQLRGRSGRQGDPGSSRFYLSLDDDLLRIFGQDKLKNIFNIVKIPEGEPLIAHRMADRLIERAQMQVEAHNFDIRKHLLQYDDVMNRQREVVYELRGNLLGQADLRDKVLDMVADVARETALSYAQGKHPELWPMDEFYDVLRQGYGLELNYSEDDLFMFVSETFAEEIEDRFLEYYKTKEQRLGSSLMREAERFFLLQTLDSLWMSHLWAMDHLRDAVRFRGYAQKDPLIEYKREAFALFEELMWKLSEDTVRKLFRFEVREESEESFKKRKKARKISERKESAVSASEMAKRRRQQPPPVDGQKEKPVKRSGTKIKPNDPCPCGSGKKYKKCCRDKEKPL